MTCHLTIMQYTETTEGTWRLMSSLVILGFNIQYDKDDPDNDI